MNAPRFQIENIRFAERDVVLRLPVRFGAATVNACPQVYVRARIRFSDGATSEGCAAEMMVLKWFDKNPALSNNDNFDQLRAALDSGRTAYMADGGAHSAWVRFALHYAALVTSAPSASMNPLTASYGPALIDRAVLDALCLHFGTSFAQALSADLCGIDVAASRLAEDLAGFDLPDFLARRTPRKSIAARHTVGLLDAIYTTDAPASAPRVGLPCSLEAAVARYGHTHFKIKLSGDSAHDLECLRRISTVIDSCAQLVTFDGNEQYANAAAFSDFLDRLASDEPLRALRQKIALVDQPIGRGVALQQNVSGLAQRVALLIDESDATLDTFVQARALGYTGVSSESCKGFYKPIINAARCAHWNATSKRHHFLSGEDLTMQAGIGVQQDLALVGWLGLSHVERNGHHYVNGMAALPAAEQKALLRQHPGLYEESNDVVRLAIRGGQLDLSSLACAGFATGVAGASIAWNAMRSTY